MNGHVLLPRLGRSRDIPFIFGTGADTSLLMARDVQRMGMDYGMFENEILMLGVGGTSENPVEVANRR